MKLSYVEQADLPTHDVGGIPVRGGLLHGGSSPLKDTVTTDIEMGRVIETLRRTPEGQPSPPRVHIEVVEHRLCVSDNGEYFYVATDTPLSAVEAYETSYTEGGLVYSEIVFPDDKAGVLEASMRAGTHPPPDYYEWLHAATDVAERELVDQMFASAVESRDTSTNKGVVNLKTAHVFTRMQLEEYVAQRIQESKE